MGNTRKELQVAALCNGTAIDHVPANLLFQVVALLKLDRLEQSVTIGNNLESKKMGTKGIIKIADKFFEEHEINRIALIAPNIVLNVIRNYEVVEKRRLKVPSEIHSFVKCNNPKCITNNEPMETRFDVIDKTISQIKCYYCNVKIDRNEIILK